MTRPGGVKAKSRVLYERYGKVVLGRARVLLGDRDAAKDVLEEVFLKIVTSESHILDEPWPLSSLYRVTTNLSLDRLREKRSCREPIVGQDDADTDRWSTGPDDPEARAMVLQIMNRVPQERQEIAVYLFVDKMTHAEIAELLGLSPRAVPEQLAQLAPRVRREPLR